MINIHPKSSQWLKRCSWVFDSKCFISSMLISFLNKIWDGKWNSGYCNWKKDNNNKLLNRVNDGTYQQFPFGMYSFVLTLSRLIEMEFLKTSKGTLWLDLHWITAYCQAAIARWYYIRGNWDDGGDFTLFLACEKTVCSLILVNVHRTRSTSEPMTLASMT